MNTRPKAVALGGGHGLYATLTALRRTGADVTAIVTVGDDGGSSGRLREELGIVPPGDLRMALSALCDDTEWGRTWRDVLQSRFDSDGPLDGHALGNLLIASLWGRTGDVVEGLTWVSRLLNAQGRVLPLALEPLDLVAVVGHDDHEIFGQVAVATSRERIHSIRVEPAAPRVADATVAAIREADMVILGPGSWFTSVLVHFLVPEVRAALCDAQSRAVLTLNVGDQDVETLGMTRADEVRALRAMAPEFRPRFALVDTLDASSADLERELTAWGCAMVPASVQSRNRADAHDPLALASALDFLLYEIG
jgi:uncharacterized cofD-like protein